MGPQHAQHDPCEVPTPRPLPLHSSPWETTSMSLCALEPCPGGLENPIPVGVLTTR